jgi:hypothetical protein
MTPVRPSAVPKSCDVIMSLLPRWYTLAVKAPKCFSSLRSSPYARTVGIFVRMDVAYFDCSDRSCGGDQLRPGGGGGR